MLSLGTELVGVFNFPTPYLEAMESLSPLSFPTKEFAIIIHQKTGKKSCNRADNLSRRGCEEVKECFASVEESTRTSTWASIVL
jgi:hypothetical protein